MAIPIGIGIFGTPPSGGSNVEINAPAA